MPRNIAPSRDYASLETVEAVLKCVREVLRDDTSRHLKDGDFTLYDRDFTGPGTSAKDILLAGEAFCTATFLGRYRGTREPDSTSFFSSRNPAPTRIELRTTNRLAFIAAAKALCSKLHGMPVSFLPLDYSWCWRDDGSGLRRRHHTVFILPMVFARTSGPFEGTAWLADVLANICASEDPRADIHLGDLLRDHKLEGLESGYLHATAAGIEVCIQPNSLLKAVLATAFGDCAHRLQKKSDQGPVYLVTLPR